MTQVYIDLDGVLADFFSEFAKVSGATPGADGRYDYRHIPSKLREGELEKLVGTNFFKHLPKCARTDQVVELVTELFGHYHICSSPLRNDHRNSATHKKTWIENNLNPKPASVHITEKKHRYAVNLDGTPNILIDDLRRNIQSWEAAGGIGIKYQADEDDLVTLIEGFSRAKKIISEAIKPVRDRVDLLNHNEIKKFDQLSQQSAKPVVGEWYIIVPIMLSPPHPLFVGKAEEAKLERSVGAELEFYTIDGYYVKYANDRSGELSLRKTFLFQDQESYGKFRSDLHKEFDIKLPQVNLKHKSTSMESASGGSTSAGNIASLPMGGKNAGTLFGGSYKQPSTKKKTKVIKR